uniref:Glutamine--fructose-6-phosphate aminotransferase [isomerizing] n=1 Tax=Cyanidium sp. THAL103 TaxID=3027999 RepID=A0A9Y1MXW4_9RHOD|nr:L-glutamine-D-fructose-6-phosphate [Cyanidium sp. THAL103]
MCGLIGYVGNQDCKNILITGMKKLEYRGYDSSGVGYVNNNKIYVIRAAGKLNKLMEKLKFYKNEFGKIGVGHTRWATHGEPNEINCHPILDNSKMIGVVQNGIIENYQDVKKQLINNGFFFNTNTDTEVIPNLIAYNKQRHNLSIIEAINKTLKSLTGNFSVIIITQYNTNTLFAYQNNSPLVIGIGKELSYFCASDPIAFINHTNNIIFLKNRELACISNKTLKIYSQDYKSIKNFKPCYINIDTVQTEKQGFQNFMLKEIYEQSSIINNMINKYKIENYKYYKNIKYTNIKNIQIIACGSSLYSAMIGKCILEKYTNIPTFAFCASEFKIEPPPMLPCVLTIAISQSGETADVLNALKIENERRRNCDILYKVNSIAITNRPRSSISRYVNNIININTGIEISVASTKTFSAQIIVFYLLSLNFIKYKFNNNSKMIDKLIEELSNIPKKIEKILLDEIQNIKKISNFISNINNIFYVGNGINWPIALEGSLKLKEVAYIHSEGCPSGEIKHGHIALLNKDMPVLILCTEKNFEKILNTAEEIKARKSPLIAVSSIKNNILETICNFVIQTPITEEILSPLCNIIVLQLISYYVALNKYIDIDQPRNLAKSVTVE